MCVWLTGREHNEDVRETFTLMNQNNTDPEKMTPPDNDIIGVSVHCTSPCPLVRLGPIDIMHPSIFLLIRSSHSPTPTSYTLGTGVLSLGLMTYSVWGREDRALLFSQGFPQCVCVCWSSASAASSQTESSLRNLGKGKFPPCVEMIHDHSELMWEWNFFFFFSGGDKNG